jgi:hypothetical protein
MRAPDASLPGKAEVLALREPCLGPSEPIPDVAPHIAAGPRPTTPTPLSAPPAAPETARAASRRAFIEETAAALGRTWAVRRRRDLHGEGRAASGGWPGTLHEARALVHHALPGEMRGRKMNAITEVEREMAVRTAYANARDEWRRHVDPEPP